MKALKLFGIFILILGCVIGILHISSDSDDHGSGTVEDSGDAQKIQSEIETYWNNASAWKPEDFEAQYNKIKQCEGVGWIDEVDSNNLTELLYALVVSRMETLQIAEYHKSECNETIIRKLMDGVNAVCKKQPVYQNNPVVKELKDCHHLYTEMLTFAHSKFDLDCNLIEDSDTLHFHRWSSYKDYATEMKGKALTFRGHNLYIKYLSNITILKVGIDSGKVEKKLAEGERAYANLLAKEIVESFSNIDEKTYDDFTKDYKNYNNEFGKFGKNDLMISKAKKLAKTHNAN